MLHCYKVEVAYLGRSVVYSEMGVALNMVDASGKIAAATQRAWLAVGLATTTVPGDGVRTDNTEENFKFWTSVWPAVDMSV